MFLAILIYITYTKMSAVFIGTISLIKVVPGKSVQSEVCGLSWETGQSFWFITEFLRISHQSFSML